MNLREVRDALTSDSIPLSTALLKAKVLASIIGAKNLRVYVDHESRGYELDQEVPAYRQVPVDSIGTFINPPHFKPIENQPIPTADLPVELKLWAETYACRDSVKAIEHLIETAPQQMLWIPWPHENVLAIPTTNIGGYGFTCVTASRCYSTDYLITLLDNVRNTVLHIVLDLAETFRDQLETEQQLSQLPPQQVQMIINNHIQGDFATVATGGTVQQSVAVKQNDIESLLATLTEVGVSATERDQLREAIHRDRSESPGEHKLGPRTQEWLGSIATKAAEKSVDWGVAAALPHIVNAIAAYFG